MGVSRRPLTLLTLALACALGALLVWLAAFTVPLGQRLDGSALAAFGVVAQPRLEPSIHGVASLANLFPLVIMATGLVGVALLRRRWLMAGLVPVILLAANVFTQLAKPGLADLRIVELPGVEGVYPASWPSGHSTVAMSLALCAVLVAGPRLRPLAAVLGAAYAISVGHSLVALGFHLPSDVLGGFLVAATFTLLGAAALARLEAPQPQPPTAVAPAQREDRGSSGPGALVTAAVAALTTLVLVGLALLAHYPRAADYAGGNPAAVLAAVAIAGLGVALTASLTLALRSER